MDVDHDWSFFTVGTGCVDVEVEAVFVAGWSAAADVELWADVPVICSVKFAGEFFGFGWGLEICKNSKYLKA